LRSRCPAAHTAQPGRGRAQAAPARRLRRMRARALRHTLQAAPPAACAPVSRVTPFSMQFVQRKQALKGALRGSQAGKDGRAEEDAGGQQSQCPTPPLPPGGGEHRSVRGVRIVRLARNAARAAAASWRCPAQARAHVERGTEGRCWASPTEAPRKVLDGARRHKSAQGRLCKVCLACVLLVGLLVPLQSMSCLCLACAKVDAGTPPLGRVFMGCGARATARDGRFHEGAVLCARAGCLFPDLKPS